MTSFQLSKLCLSFVAIAVTASASVDIASAANPCSTCKNDAACEQPCDTCPKHSYWWKWPQGLHGRNAARDVPCGTETSCPPQGPYYGYYPTCWRRMPSGLMQCPPAECEVIVPTEPPIEYMPTPEPSHNKQSEAPRPPVRSATRAEPSSSAEAAPPIAYQGREMVAAAPSFVPPQQAAAPVEAPRQAVAQAQVQRLPVVEPIRAVSIIERLPQVAVMPVAAVPVGTIPLGTAPVAVAPSNEARPATPPIEQVAVAPTPTPVMHVVERIAAPPAVEVAPAPAATLPKAVPLASEVAVAAQPATPRAEKTEMPDTVVKGMGRQTGVARTAQPAYGVRNVATVDVSPAPTVNMPKVIQTQTRTAAPTSIVANKPTSSTVAKTTPPSHGIRNLTATDAWQTATASDKSAVSQPVEVRQAMTTRPAATYGRAPAVHGSTYR